VEPHDYDERFRHHEAILEGLARMFAAQHEMNQRVEGFIQEQRSVNAELHALHAEQVAINQRLEITQARLETLVSRALRMEENGQEA
jgi:hypothetical protein